MVTRRKVLAGLAVTAASAWVALNWRRRSEKVVADVEGTMLTVAYEIEGDDKAVTDAVAESRATRYDIIICLEKQYKAQVAGLLSRHPSLVVGSYINGTHSRNAPPYHAHEWYVWDKDGVPVRSKAFPLNFLMNPRSGWVEYVVQQIPRLTAAGYNAIYVDELGVGPIRTEGTTSQAVLPGTTTPWTVAEWQPDMEALCAKVQGATDRLVYVNGLGNGARYFAAGTAATSGLLGSADKALGESFLRGAVMPTEPGKLFKASDTSWKHDIAMVADAGVKGMFCTKIWSYPTNAVINNQVEGWATGSFLLGCTPKTGWFFSGPKKTTVGVPAWRPMYDRMRDLGSPIGDATFSGSKGHRDFTNGYVDVDNALTRGTVVVAS